MRLAIIGDGHPVRPRAAHMRYEVSLETWKHAKPTRTVLLRIVRERLTGELARLMPGERVYFAASRTAPRLLSLEAIASEGDDGAEARRLIQRLRSTRKALRGYRTDMDAIGEAW